MQWFGSAYGLASLLLPACSQERLASERITAETPDVLTLARSQEPARADVCSLESAGPIERFECALGDDEMVTFELVATARRTPIFERPHVGSPRVGYLRAGQVVTRSAQPVKGEGCARGFYAIEPRGYVCVGVEASLNLEHPARWVNLSAPDRARALPYTYGMSRYPTPPLYTRVPTPIEQSRTEPNIERYLPKRDMTEWLALGYDEVPEFLADHAPSFHTNGVRRGRKPLTEGNAFVESGFALARRFRVGERSFGLTTDLQVLPLDRLNWMKESLFRGVELTSQVQLPLAFVRADDAVLFEGQPDLGLRPGRKLTFREAVPLTGVRHTHEGRTYHQATDGAWLEHTSRVTVVEPRGAYPSWAQSDRTWVDVSLLHQTLVAYRGQTAEYATLVSSGRDGVRDAATSHATLQGQFVIHTKHLTAPMTGSGEGGAFDLRDVPYVQYFSGGYALHAAYWHDAFGQPKSHGCINLSPRDAQWLFEWTQPSLPAQWHSVLSNDGTWITIHP